MTETPVKTLDLPASGSGEYHIVAEVHEYRLEFKCYEQTAKNMDGTPCYQRRGAMSSPDFVDSIHEAEVFLSGSIKWDGCANVRFDEQDEVMLHFCGQDETDKIGLLFAKLYALAAEHIPTWCGHVNALLPATAERVVSIHQCARCGGKHEAIEFKPLSNAPDEWKFFAMCPTLNQPIMVAITSEGTAA
jgi:hypothetical protein